MNAHSVIILQYVNVFACSPFGWLFQHVNYIPSIVTELIEMSLMTVC
jgi:isoprenylcysteine carboxyl methyltransferase (ICMT) family protein YpbQ